MSWKPVSLSTDALDTSNVGGTFAVFNKNGVEQMWNLSGNEATLPRSSVKVSTSTPGGVVSTQVFSQSTILQRVTVTGNTAASTANYADIVYEADVISPVTGLTTHLSYTLGASKAWTYVWDTTVVPVWGIETVLPFTLKYS